jgi:hypothetical protein
MNKKSKMFFVCGFALAMMAVTTQQNVKADTTTDAPVETAVAEQTPEVSKATQSSTTQAVAEQTSQATDDVQATTTQASTDATQTTTDNNQASTQADADTNDAKITPVKGVVTTGNDITYLYKQDGTQLTNRALAPNTPWATDQRLTNNGSVYYRVATDEFADGKNVVLSFGADANGVIRLNLTVQLTTHVMNKASTVTDNKVLPVILHGNIIVQIMMVSILIIKSLITFG